MISHNIYINRLEVIPNTNNLSNVVARVYWEMIFTDGEFVSKAGGVTALTAPDGSNFTPAEELTESQVSEWVRSDLQSKGFEQQLIEYHTAAIEEQVARKNLVVWQQPLLEQKSRPTESVVSMVA